MRRLAVTLLMAVLMPLGVLAQEGWGNLDQLLRRTLAPGADFETSFWLPDRSDAAAATVAVGVIYPIIQGAAGNTGIAIGVFLRSGNGWAFRGEVAGLFGHNPRDASFTPSYIDLTTTTLGPNEPRCCPTQATRWRIDLADMSARALP